MSERQFILSQKEQAAFKRAEAASKVAGELKRLQAVRLYGEGRPTREIEAVIGCEWRSLLRWVQHYQREGLAGLADKRRGGNRAKLTQEQRRGIREKVHQYRPDQVLPAEVRISRGIFWTVSDVSLAVRMWYGVTYQSPTSYLNLLHECGFSQQKVERQYRSRPSEADIAEFEARLEKK